MTNEEARSVLLDLSQKHPKVFGMIRYQAKKRGRADFIRVYEEKFRAKRIRKDVEASVGRKVSSTEVRTILGVGHDMVQEGEL